MFTNFDPVLSCVTVLGMRWKGLVHGSCLLDFTKIRSLFRHVASLFLPNRSATLLCFVYVLYLVPSIHNTYKDQMLYDSWVIPGDMFWPLNSHLQSNIE